MFEYMNYHSTDLVFDGHRYEKTLVKSPIVSDIYFLFLTSSLPALSL